MKEFICIYFFCCSEGLGEGYDGDIAFASALETFGGGHNDPISVAFGGMSFITVLFLANNVGLLSICILHPVYRFSLTFSSLVFAQMLPTLIVDSSSSWGIWMCPD